MALNSLPLTRKLETQVYSFTLTAGQNFDLPSAVKAGQTVLVFNETANNSELIVRSSAAATIETISKGYCLVVAKQDTPTTAAHWVVLDVQDQYSAIATFVHPNFSPTSSVAVSRSAKVVTVRIQDFTTAGSITTGGNTFNATAFLPARYRPAIAMFLSAIVRNAGSTTTGSIEISTGGTLTVASSYAGVGFTAGSPAGFGQTSNNQSFSYLSV